MKKITVALLTVLMVFAFCGCKQKSYLQFEHRGLTVMLNADGTPYTGE